MDFELVASSDRIERTIQTLKSRGIAAEFVGSAEAALARIRELVPPGASLASGASLTLKEIGFEALLLSGEHPWRNLKGEYLAEQDRGRQLLLRRQSSLADYYLGSVHAVAETGEIVIASMTGSQLAPYAYTASNLVWVVGAQKLVPNLAEGIRRIREYILPHEELRMRELTGGAMGSMIGKILIIEREAAFLSRKVSLLFVGQRLGD